jgi:hypothetical protein
MGGELVWDLVVREGDDGELALGRAGVIDGPRMLNHWSSKSM